MWLTSPSSHWPLLPRASPGEPMSPHSTASSCTPPLAIGSRKKKKKMHFRGQIVEALSWNQVPQVWPGAHLWDKHSRPLLLQRHQHHTLLLPGKTLLTHLREEQGGTSLMVQWLGFCTSTTAGTGSIPGQGTKILQVSQSRLFKKKRKREAS